MAVVVTIGTREEIVGKILTHFMIKNAFIPASKSLILTMGDIIYQVSITKKNDFFSAKFTTIQTGVPLIERISNYVLGEDRLMSRIVSDFLNIHTYAAKGNKDKLEHLISNPHLCINIQEETGMTLLNFAASKGHIQCVKLLIKFGAEVDFPELDGWTPLHCAVLDGYVECVKLLLNQGANVDTPNQERWTPLNTAVRSHQIECVRLLLKHGADVDIPNKYGQTPLMIAANILAENRSDNDFLECLTLLLNSNANPNLVNGRHTPLKFIVDHLTKKTDQEEIKVLVKAMELLLNSGADIDVEWGLSPAKLTIKEIILSLKEPYTNQDIISLVHSRESTVTAPIKLQHLATKTIRAAIKEHRKVLPFPEAVQKLTLPEKLKASL